MKRFTTVLIALAFFGCSPDKKRDQFVQFQTLPVILVGISSAITY
jgi:hypothetical protein